jgi:hypothetical protein
MNARSAVPLALLLALICHGAPAAAHDALTNYRLYCMGCHVADASGLEGKVPSLRETLVPLAQRPDGRRFLVQVPGVALSPLSDADVATLLNWMILALAENPASERAPDFSEEEVARYRSERLVAVRDTRAELLARIQEDSGR